MSFDQPWFWLALLKIVWIDMLLSGDNAVVIALACRSLPEGRRKWGMILGAGVAVGLRIAFAGVVTTLMAWPWLRIIGGLALLYIAVDLVKPSDGEEEGGITAHDSLWRAVITIAAADVVMSLDNVVAIAAVADGHLLLLGLGVAISIPLIVGGSAILMKLLDRFSWLVWAGGALLGWIAGEVIITDKALEGFLGSTLAHQLEIPAGILGMAIVLSVGYLLTRRQRAEETEETAVSS